MYIEFIVPTELTLGEPLVGQIHGDFAQIYRFAVTEQETAASVLVTEVASSDQSINQLEMRMRANVPPGHVFDCKSYQRDFEDEQCILTGQGVTDWYAVVYGDEGIRYNITVQASKEQYSEQYLPFGSEALPYGGKQLFEQGAVTIRYFKVPKGDLDKILILAIEDNADANFKMVVRDSPDGNVICRLVNPMQGSRICRMYEGDRDTSSTNNEQEYWYLEVKSAVSGSYYLWAAEQEITDLQAGVPLRDALNEAHPGMGMVYRIAIPEESALFTASVADKTKPMFMVAYFSIGQMVV